MNQTFLTCAILTAALCASAGEDLPDKNGILARLEKARTELAALHAQAAQADPQTRKSLRSRINYEQAALDELAPRLPWLEVSDTKLREEAAQFIREFAALDVQKEAARKSLLKEAEARLLELDFRINERLRRPWEHTRFSVIVKEAGRQIGAPVVLHESLRGADPPVLAPPRGATAEDFLKAACNALDAEYEVRGGEILIMSGEARWQRDHEERMNRKVTFEIVETPLEEAIGFMRQLANETFVLMPGARAKAQVPISRAVKDVPLADALALILKDAGMESRAINRALAIGTKQELAALKPFSLPPAADDQTRQLLGRRISFEFVETPLKESLDFIRSLVKTNLIALPRVRAEKAESQITLRVQDMPLHFALYWDLRMADLEVDWALGSLTVGMQGEAEQARKLEEIKIADATLRRRLQRPVTFEFVETPAIDAAQYFNSLLKDPKVLQVAAGAEGHLVSLRLTDQPLEIALKWTGLLAGLDVEYDAKNAQLVYKLKPDAAPKRAPVPAKPEKAQDF